MTEGVADRKRLMLRWHKACVRWALSAGEELPEWAAGIRGGGVTAKDVERLGRESDVRLMWGKVTPDSPPIRGLLDFVATSRPAMTLTEVAWDEHVSRVKNDSSPWYGGRFRD